MSELRVRRVHRTRCPQRALAIETRQRAVGSNGASGNRCDHGRSFRLGLFLLGGGRGRSLTRCQRFVLRHLPHQHVGQTDTTTLAGHGNGQLLVVHFLILLGCRRVERVVLAQRFGGGTHRLEHFAKEQRFEFLRHFAQVRIAVLVADLELVQAIEVRVGTRIAAADQTTFAHIHKGRPQITIRSACNAPACFRASRIAIKSPGAAPT